MFQRQWRQAQKPRRHVATKSKGGVKKTVARKKPDWDVREIVGRFAMFIPAASLCWCMST